MAGNVPVLFLVIIASFLLGRSNARPAEETKPTYTSYLPFYGGGKGQYLQVTKDAHGEVLKETIVSEDKVMKVSGEPSNGNNLLSKVFEVNLQKVQASAQNVLALQQMAKKSGHISLVEREKLNAQLKVLGESVANLANLSEVGTQDLTAILGGTKYKEDHKFEEDVGEEGVGIDSEGQTPENGNGSVAEAKPVGLAIAGEGGVASSKPIATAVVGAGGIAVARPVATAIAGVDPAALGVGITYGKI